MDQAIGASFTAQDTGASKYDPKKADSASMVPAPEEPSMFKCTAYRDGCNVQHVDRDFVDRK